MLSLQETYAGIDPILTSVAQGYVLPDMNIGNFIAPVVATPTRAGRILRFGKEAFATGDYRRQWGTVIHAVQSRYDSLPYALEQESLAYEIPVELIEEAGNGPAQIDLRKIELRNLLQRITNSYEVRVANAVTTSSNYETSTYAATFGALPGTPTGGIQGANSIQGILAAKRAVSDQIGIRPNSAIFGTAVYDAMMTSTTILERIKYTSADSINLDLIARYFGLDRGIRVADGRILDTTTGKLLPYFPENAVVLFYSPLPASSTIMPAMGADMATPAFAYTYQLSAGPQVTPEFLVKERRVVRAEVTIERAVALTGLGETGKVGSGFYIANALT